jgi:hypothetical protein
LQPLKAVSTPNEDVTENSKIIAMQDVIRFIAFLSRCHTM